MKPKARLSYQTATLALGLALTLPGKAGAADALLSGTVKSASGEAMGGATVSAKSGTITTTVFTDEAGNYYFPPLSSGKYQVWAQALSFATAKSEVDLAASRHHDFTLAPITDYEQQVRQLPGDLILAGLPEDTPDDRRLKQIVRNNCTSCHTPSYTLQHRFDESGWNAIIQTMKQINVYGIYRPGGEVNKVLDFHQKELAAYLARVDLPGAIELAQGLAGERLAGEMIVSSIAFGLPWDKSAEAELFLSRYPPEEAWRWLAHTVTWKIATLAPGRANARRAKTGGAHARRADRRHEAATRGAT